MRSRVRPRAVVAWAAVVGVLAAAIPGMSWADPAPNSGPVAGGTTVKLSLPQTAFTQTSSPVYGSLESFTVATTAEGAAYAWGLNDNGQLGNGTKDASETPTPVTMPAGVGFTQIATGNDTSLGLGNDGNVYVWGSLYNRSAGTWDVPSPALTPVKVQGFPSGLKIKAIAAGLNHYLALGEDGSLWGWGSNISGQLGIGAATPGDYNPPTRTHLPEGVTVKSVTASQGVTFVLDSQGNVWGAGQFGIGHASGFSFDWTKMPLPAVEGGYKAVAAGAFFAMALGADGDIYSWGNNAHGQLGDGTTTSVWQPVKVDGKGVKFSSVAAGVKSSFAISTDGTSYAWGFGTADPYYKPEHGHWMGTGGGQLGIGGIRDASTPTPIVMPTGVSFKAIKGGWFTSKGIGSDGYVYTWGNGYDMGTGGTNPHSDVPVRIPNPAVTLTGVTFGGVPADIASFQEQSRGVWTVKTPAHEAGPVDVVVSWTLGGVAQKDVTYRNGFTYTLAPTLSNPVDVTVDHGSRGDFTVSTDGYPSPTVTWEYSSDGGKSWSNAADLSSLSVSDDALSLSLVGTEQTHGWQFRATATNDVGQAISEPATLTVRAKAQPTPQPSVTPTSSPQPSVSPTSSPRPSVTPTVSPLPSVSPTTPTRPGPPSTGAVSVHH